MRDRSIFAFILTLGVVVVIAGCSSGSSSGPECITIDKSSHSIHPPAGVRVVFRVLDCDGYPVRPLTSADVTIINDEKGEPFGSGGEGGGASAPGVPSEFGLFSILALDMSDSIFNNNAVNDVIDGAKIFVQKMVIDPDRALRHKVALLVFGSTNETSVVLDFTDDAQALNTKLEELRTSTSLGTTNLYGAYMMALEEVCAQGLDLDPVERSVVILTDGTHEAGNESELQANAIAAKDQAETDSSLTAFSIGIRGNYDESKLEELASKSEYFVISENAGDLEIVFEDVARRVEAIANSNYAIGVCTPVELGNPSLTIQVEVDGEKDSETVPYPTDQLTGDVSSCDEVLIADPCHGLDCGPGALPGSDCGTCPGPTDYCTGFGMCVDDCEGRECGLSPNAGISCGSCSPVETCRSGQCECSYSECSGQCCAMNEVCYNGSCCLPSCGGKDCGNNGCGGSCGTCGTNSTCVNDLCVCDFVNCLGQCCSDGEVCFNDQCCMPDCTGVTFRDHGSTFSSIMDPTLRPRFLISGSALFVQHLQS